jgi:hypothetical protein
MTICTSFHCILESLGVKLGIPSRKLVFIVRVNEGDKLLAVGEKGGFLIIDPANYGTCKG